MAIESESGDGVAVADGPILLLLTGSFRIVPKDESAGGGFVLNLWNHIRVQLNNMTLAEKPRSPASLEGITVIVRRQNSMTLVDDPPAVDLLPAAPLVFSKEDMPVYPGAAILDKL